jgi:hypothetical protein
MGDPISRIPKGLYKTLRNLQKHEVGFPSEECAMVKNTPLFSSIQQYIIIAWHLNTEIISSLFFEFGMLFLLLI